MIFYFFKINAFLQTKSAGHASTAVLCTSKAEQSDTGGKSMAHKLAYKLALLTVMASL